MYIDKPFDKYCTVYADYVLFSFSMTQLPIERKDGMVLAEVNQQRKVSQIHYDCSSYLSTFCAATTSCSHSAQRETSMATVLCVKSIVISILCTIHCRSLSLNLQLHGRNLHRLRYLILHLFSYSTWSSSMLFQCQGIRKRKTSRMAFDEAKQVSGAKL